MTIDEYFVISSEIAATDGVFLVYNVKSITVQVAIRIPQGIYSSFLAGRYMDEAEIC